MAYYPTKKEVKTAITDHNRFPVQAVHQTTSDFFHIGIEKIHPVVKGQKINWNVGTYGLLAPMPNPTYGIINDHSRAFFVPFHTICDFYDSLISDNIYNSYANTTSTPSQARYTTIGYIATAIKSNMTTTGASATNYDFIYDNNGTPQYYLHTRTSKNMWRLLCQLGMRVPMITTSQEQVSAMPLLALARVFNDWYFNENYKNNTNYNNVEKIIRQSDSNYVLGSGNISTLLKHCMYCFYEPSWFVDAWDNPESPSVAYGSNVTIEDPTYTGSYVSKIGQSKPYFDMANAITNPNPGYMTQYNVNTLKALTDFVKRNQLAGNDNLKRYYARFGKILNDELAKRSKKIAENTISTNIYKVESNADTASAGGDQLGAFGGNAEIKGNTYNVNYECPDDGYIIIINNIAPKVVFDQGMKPIALQKTKFDFWAPEFDGIGTEVVRKVQVINVDNEQSALAGVTLQDIFGWLPRYWHYKVLTDQITGDYEIRSKQSYYESFALKREFNPLTLANAVHSGTITNAETSWQQFDRIFYGTADKFNPEDHFNLWHWIEGEMYAPFKKLYDNYDFDNNHHDEEVNV